MTRDEQKMHMKMLAQHHANAMVELKAGKKKTHWSWWVFPMLQGLRESVQAGRYALTVDGARTYYANHALRNYLHETTAALRVMVGTTTLEDALGEVDAGKVVSCLTLFRFVSADPTFRDDIEAVLKGRECEYTMNVLRGLM